MGLSKVPEMVHPASVLGPVLLRELRRLVSNCLTEVSLGSASKKWLRFVVRALFDSLVGFCPTLVVTARCGQWMAFQPQGTRGNDRINAQLFPPCRFIATAVDLAMMAATQGNRELVADFAAKRL